MGTTKKRLDQIDLRAMWQQYLNSTYYWTEADFMERLRRRTHERPQLIQECLRFCVDCGHPTWKGGTRENGTGQPICATCWEYYRECAGTCGGYHRYFTTTSTGENLCRPCLTAGGWTHCDQHGWYPQQEQGEHNHGGPGCECESPAQTFMVRNDGEPPLANDTRVQVTLPAGLISNEGLYAIAQALRNESYGIEQPARNLMWQVASHVQCEGLGNLWQTKEGNFTKRLSRYAYNTYGLKITPKVISNIGCIARDHSTSVDFAIETTRNLNLPPQDFAHEDSCWWQSYAGSRCALKSNGGFGLRSFNEWGVSGRAWVMPLRQDVADELMPTFETQAPDAFMVFNGYGDLSGYTAARIVAHMAGMTYRKIEFTATPMYVNGDSGYLVAPEEIAAKYTDENLSLELEMHADLFENEMETANAA